MAIPASYCQESPHVPVLFNEVLQYMSPQDDEIYVDGTFGAGGHSRGLLAAAKCHVYGIDRDATVQPFARQLEKDYPGRFTLLAGNYGEMQSLLEKAGLDKVHGILLDIGVSSMQLDTPERGFSFQHDAPLDMRMGNQGRTAAELVNRMEEKELADIIYRYGEEHKSRHIARAIVLEREKGPITGTIQLAEIVRKVVRGPKNKIDPATKTFQAIRIWVNNELEELSDGLQAAEQLLLPGGRLVIISFHSLEDSMVKQFLLERSGRTMAVSRYQPEVAVSGKPPTFSILTKKAVKPTEEEVDRNIRARSARLRAGVRTKTPCTDGQLQEKSI